MENKIPTVEELCLDYEITNPIDGLPIGIEAIIEFTKMHVTEALRQASEKAYYRDNDGFIMRCKENKKVILNAYPLNNIK